MNDWKTIWNQKEANLSDCQTEFEMYITLKRANGFDVAVENETEYYKFFYQDWLSFYKKILQLTDSINSVYEIGCGSGVNLFLFQKRGIDQLGGIDYSKSLVSNAKTLLNITDIETNEAIKINSSPQYDLVMADSVFQYFQDDNYAETVLRTMIQKSRKLTYLGEVHDKIYEADLIQHRRETIENYDEHYKGLEKHFYSKSWIENIANEYGKQVLYTQVNNPYYINSKYVYNCYIVDKKEE